MWPICKNEFRQFFSSLTGLIAVVVFLLLNGLILFVFPESSIFDFGYVTLEKFFQFAPLILLLLIPAITMRSFSDEFKTGTYEILQTRPLAHWQIIMGKYTGAMLIAVTALIPTVLYVISLQALSENAGIDAGAAIGSYAGLVFLSAVFTAIGLCCSSFTNNTVIAFLISAFACFLVYSGFDAISKIPSLHAGADYYLEMLGLNFHYTSISRGVADSRDVVYFLSVVAFFLFLIRHNLVRR